MRKVPGVSTSSARCYREHRKNEWIRQQSAPCRKITHILNIRPSKKKKGKKRPTYFHSRAEPLILNGCKKYLQNHWKTPVMEKLAMETHRKEGIKGARGCRYSVIYCTVFHWKYKGIISIHQNCNRYIILRVKMCYFNDARQNTNLEEESKEFKKNVKIHF